MSHCLFQYFDLAADVLAENAHLTYKFLSPVSSSLSLFVFSEIMWLNCVFLLQYMYEFLDALLTCQTAPEEVRFYFIPQTNKPNLLSYQTSS